MPRPPRTSIHSVRHLVFALGFAAGCDTPSLYFAKDAGADVAAIDAPGPGDAGADGGPLVDGGGIDTGGTVDVQTVDVQPDTSACGGCARNQFCGTDTLCHCLGGYADCNRMLSDGCETAVGTDLMNCSACGLVCARTNGIAECAEGSCGLHGCLRGWGNCDGNPDNGCETDVTSDGANCGRCTVACSAGQRCVAGVCG